MPILIKPFYSLIGKYLIRDTDKQKDDVEQIKSD